MQRPQGPYRMRLCQFQTRHLYLRMEMWSALLKVSHHHRPNLMALPGARGERSEGPFRDLLQKNLFQVVRRKQNLFIIY